MATFSARVKATPADCSPSRSVVSLMSDLDAPCLAPSMPRRIHAGVSLPDAPPGSAVAHGMNYSKVAFHVFIVIYQTIKLVSAGLAHSRRDIVGNQTEPAPGSGGSFKGHGIV